MKAAHRPFAVLFCAATAFAGLASGCTVGGKSFYIDSNSRVPFFGLELKERKPKSSAPSYDSISHSRTDNSRIETALGTGSSTSVGLLKKSDPRRATARVSTGNEISTEAITLSQSGSRSRPVQSIPLPRTDDHSSTPERQAASSAVDFQ